MKRWVDRVSVLALLLAVIWMLPSSLFVKPLSVTYHNGVATLTVDMLLPGTDVLWTTHMTVNSTGFTCFAPSNRVRHISDVGLQLEGDGVPVSGAGLPVQSRASSNFYSFSGVIVYRVGDWAEECLNAEPPIGVYHRFSYLLLGVIPLRPVELITVIY